MFAVAPGLARLGADAVQATVHLVDDVGKSEEILFHPVETAEGLDLLRLEAADSGRFLENDAAFPAEDWRSTSTLPCSMML